MRPPSVAEHLRRISSALQDLGVRWYVFGAQAVIAAGAVRTTADIDITTEDVAPSRLQAVLAKAGFRLRRDVEDIDELIEHHRILPMEHPDSGMQLDVVRAGPGPEERLRRAGRTGAEGEAGPEASRSGPPLTRHAPARCSIRSIFVTTPVIFCPSRTTATLSCANTCRSCGIVVSGVTTPCSGAISASIGSVSL